MKYGKAIRICRTATGLTQAELAEQLSIGPSQLSLLEAGKRQPSVKTLAQISSALGVPPHLLTLLAYERQDLQNREKDPDIKELANALLRLLVNVDEQPTLPFKP